jgi:hypothetical protein
MTKSAAQPAAAECLVIRRLAFFCPLSLGFGHFSTRSSAGREIAIMPLIGK